MMKKDKVGTIIFFFVLPLFSLPLLIKQIYRGERYAFSLLAIFIGFIGLLYPPSGDLYRYAQDYYYVLNLPFKDFLSVIQGKMDFFYYFVLWIFGKLGLSHDHVRFIFVWIGAELTFEIFYKLTTDIRLNNKRATFRLFIILILFVDFLRYSYRFGLSNIFLVYSVFSIFYQKKYTKGFVFLALSIINHYSYVLYAIIILFVSLFNFKGSRLFSIAAIITLFTSAAPFVGNLVNALPINLSIIEHLMVYVDGVWAGDYLQDMSFRYKILLFLNSSIVLFLCFLYLYTFNKSKMSGFLTLSIIMMGIFSFSATLKERFEYAIILPLLVFLISWLVEKHYMLKKKSHVIMMVLFMFGSISFFSSIWSRRVELSISKQYKLLYSPAPLIFFSTYDKNWIDNNIGPDACPYVVKQ